MSPAENCCTSLLCSSQRRAIDEAAGLSWSDSRRWVQAVLETIQKLYPNISAVALAAVFSELTKEDFSYFRITSETGDLTCLLYFSKSISSALLPQTVLLLVNG